MTSRSRFDGLDDERHERNRSIVDLYVNHQPITLEEIGDKFGISRERVRQILKRAKVDTRSVIAGRSQDRENAKVAEWMSINRLAPRVCVVCGETFKPQHWMRRTCSQQCSYHYQVMPHKYRKVNDSE